MSPASSIATDDAGVPASSSLATAPFPTHPEFLAFLNANLSALTPQEIVDWAVVSLPGLVQTTAFGLTGLAIRDMISKSEALKRTGREIPLIFLDTLYHFPETLELAQDVATRYNTPLHVFRPDGADTVEEFERVHGQRLWETSPETYDFAVKVEPGRRAVETFAARVTITGRRRSQGAKRAAIPILELDSSVEPPMLKLNVLAAWDYDAVWKYIQENNVPYNKLHDKGYKSIGDWHSTAPTAPGSGERDGRWAGQAKTECGLHEDYFKMRAAFVAAQKRKAAEDAAAAANKDEDSKVAREAPASPKSESSELSGGTAVEREAVFV